ncbi:MAG: hypothetical protein EOP59_11585, partial [Sphingomonadales bacterium]
MSIPPIDPPTIAPNVAESTTLDASLSIGAGTVRYASGLGLPMYRGGFFPFGVNLDNAGTLWIDNATGASLFQSNLFGAITNSGAMVARSSGGVANTIGINSSFQGLSNSGSIYAIGATSASAVSDWSGSPAVITNSGIIAAQATGSSFAVTRVNGGGVVNTASGSILSESGNAVGVSLYRGHFIGDGSIPDTMIDLQNAGLIEAISTPGAAYYSVAVQIATGSYERNHIVNSGVIRGDYAIVADGTSFSPAAHSTETVTNEAIGLIEGAISLGLGDDRIVNRGTILGWIDMGEDSDSVDNRTGTISGATFLGNGADIFWGGAGTDVALGDRGDDTLLGGVGNDLLLGGYGDDVLQGDAGAAQQRVIAAIAQRHVGAGS